MKYQGARDNLSRFYEAVNPDLNTEEFVKRINDYTDYIYSVNYLNSEIQDFKSQVVNSRQVFAKKEEILVKEIGKLIIDIRKAIDNAGIQNNSIENIFLNDILPIQKNKTSSSVGKAESLLRYVYDLLNILKGLNKENIVSNSGQIKDYKWNLSIDTYIEQYYSEKERHNEYREKKLWGCWDYIYIISKADSFIYTKDFKGFGKDIDFIDKAATDDYVSLFHALRSNNKQDQQNIKRDTKNKLERLHHFLFKKIDEAEDAKFWTKRGLINFGNTDVSSIIVNIIWLAIVALFSYFLGKLSK